MKKLYFLVAAVFTTMFIVGCASIVTGTDQNVTFNSEPDGATVTVAGKVIGKTPLSVQIDKGKLQSLTFEKEGYKTHSTQLTTTITGWFWGNIICCGLLGSTTDGVSGAMIEFSPDQYFITLTPKGAYGLSTSRPRKIKELVIAFSDEVRFELASGGGEHTKAILAVLDINGSEKNTTIKVLNKLAFKNKNDLDFAKSIIDFYDIK
ncbi:MAG: PEGA domain-containing protein [Pseudomonadota bacterium]